MKLHHGSSNPRALFRANVGDQGMLPGTAPSRDPHHHKPVGEIVEARCWCEKRWRQISADLMRAGITESCGSDRCNRLEARALAAIERRRMLEQ